MSSEKYKAAKKTNRIKCVNVQWINDSIKMGYALPETNYSVRAATSTPTKDHENLDPNFSTMSAIPPNSFMQMPSPAKNTFYETMDSTALQVAARSTPQSSKTSLKRKGNLKYFVCLGMQYIHVCVILSF